MATLFPFSDYTEISNTSATLQTSSQKKRPGRKPNPNSAELRKAQNRAAQRAFRERRERHLKELEEQLQKLRESDDQSSVKIRCLKAMVDNLETENLLLRQISLGFMHIMKTNEMPLEKLDESFGQLFGAGEMKPSEFLHSLELTDDYLPKECGSRATAEMDSEVARSLFNGDGFLPQLIPPKTEYNMDVETTPITPNLPLDSSPPGGLFNMNQLLPPLSLGSPVTSNDGSGDNSSPERDVCERNMVGRCKYHSGKRLYDPNINMNTVEAAAIIAMRLRSGTDIPETGKPTYLQKTVPHDERIDMVPCPRMRDKLIMFAGNYDIEHFFSELMNTAVCHGDPLVPQSWEISEGFYEKFPFLLCLDCPDSLRRMMKIKIKRDQKTRLFESLRGHHQGEKAGRIFGVGRLRSADIFSVD
ncbi:uncharacterized protein VTP21DRAFT_11105 [Calcarisporiella thermophila]|uniref:uncharacterized protein n=1 Tax=Calcarisporiella thermophila TaxID=911321 RepID=UPI003743817B